MSSDAPYIFMFLWSGSFCSRRYQSSSSVLLFNTERPHPFAMLVSGFTRCGDHHGSRSAYCFKLGVNVNDIDTIFSDLSRKQAGDAGQSLTLVVYLEEV